MRFFWRKQEAIEQMVNRYLEQCDNCFASFERALAIYFESGLIEAFGAEVQKIHEAESTADNIRREIELTLFGKALLPDSRGDVLNLLEAFDKLPNTAETILYVLQCQKTKIPRELVAGTRDLSKLNVEAYHLVRKSVDELFDNSKETLQHTKQVKAKESEIDRLERQIICNIFELDFDNGTRMLLKEIVLLLGSISDKAESVSDQVALIAVKRQV